jgi:hypothetical protein
MPSSKPTTQPSCQPSRTPTDAPSSMPSAPPTRQPSKQPSGQPTQQPSKQPSSNPSCQPSLQPNSKPSSIPSLQPNTKPSRNPTLQPFSIPSTQPSPTQEPSTASTNTVPSITTTVSAGKKSFLDKTTKSLRKKEKREKKTKDKNQSSEKDKVKSKKQKKKDKKKSPAKTGKANAGFAQNVPGNPTIVLDLEKPENVASAMDRAGEVSRFPDSVHGRSALSFLLTDLQSEEQQGKDRIALIDRTIEELQLERKALTDKVLALKQQQFDLLRSAMTANSFVNDSPSSTLESVTATIEVSV